MSSTHGSAIAHVIIKYINLGFILQLVIHYLSHFNECVFLPSKTCWETVGQWYIGNVASPLTADAKGA